MTFRLAFGEKSFDQLRGIARSRFFQRTGSGFDHIGEGEERGFWRLGNRSRVTERGLADGGISSSRRRRILPPVRASFSCWRAR